MRVRRAWSRCDLRRAGTHSIVSAACAPPWKFRRVQGATKWGGCASQRRDCEPDPPPGPPRRRRPPPAAGGRRPGDDRDPRPPARNRAGGRVAHARPSAWGLTRRSNGGGSCDGSRRPGHQALGSPVTHREDPRRWGGEGPFPSTALDPHRRTATMIGMRTTVRPGAIPGIALAVAVVVAACGGPAPSAAFRPRRPLRQPRRPRRGPRPASRKARPPPSSPYPAPARPPIPRSPPSLPAEEPRTPSGAPSSTSRPTTSR